ncbi:unnamed protein product [Protopolystoma xenopodis]|uniref:Uncharacterized protein n=1 Tax=Protopolystoma xenopodis TaxID=117903 RepID=A0A3S5BN19_9PLAT|nr:unnamed protein product [Protopolystoma xenopodis]
MFAATPRPAVWVVSSMNMVYALQPTFGHPTARIRLSYAAFTCPPVYTLEKLAPTNSFQVVLVHCQAPSHSAAKSRLILLHLFRNSYFLPE